MIARLIEISYSGVGLSTAIEVQSHAELHRIAHQIGIGHYKDVLDSLVRMPACQDDFEIVRLYLLTRTHLFDGALSDAHEFFAALVEQRTEDAMTLAWVQYLSTTIPHQNETALESLTKSITLHAEFERLNNKFGAALASTTIGTCRLGQHDTAGALEAMFEAHKVLAYYPDLPLANGNLVNMAVALQRLNDVPTARKYYLEALQREQLARPSAINCTILHNLALLEKTAENYEASRLWYTRALEVARTIANIEREYALEAGLTDLMLRMGEVVAVGKGLDAIDDAVLRRQSVSCQTTVYSAQWKLASARGNTVDAERAFEIALGLAHQHGKRDDTVQLLREYLDENPQSAPTERRQVMYHELVTLLDAKQRETADTIPRSVEARVAQQQTIRNLELRREQDKLDVSIAAREQTIRDVGSTLHDDIGQSLTVLGLKVDHLLRNPTENFLQELTTLRSDIRRITEGVRSLSHTLSGQLLETRGLSAAIENIANDVRSAGIEVQCVTWGDESALTHDVALCLYRCTQTAVQNALRHGNPQALEIQLGVLDEEVMVAINDSGSGFDQATTKFGLGLRDAANRIERLGGKLQLDSHPGRGTYVRFSIPIERP